MTILKTILQWAVPVVFALAFIIPIIDGWRKELGWRKLFENVAAFLITAIVLGLSIISIGLCLNWLYGN